MITFYFNPKNDKIPNSDDTMVIVEEGIISMFPLSEDNRHYCMYLDWVAEGNEASVWGPDAPDWPA